MGSTFSRLNHPEIIQRLNDKLLLILRTQRLFCVCVLRFIIILTIPDTQFFFRLSNKKERFFYAVRAGITISQNYKSKLRQYLSEQI